MGEAEITAAAEVIASNRLSGFLGSPGDDFNGGPVVQEFEEAWARRFEVHDAVSVNSATSGLIAAVGAAGVGHGDEVIVPPYTMSATAVAPLVYGGVPVFVDIDPEYFCIDVAATRRAITAKTKVIIAVDLFGHPAALANLRALADEYDIVLIEDASQSPTAVEDGRYAGTVGHMGVYSLNYHKHIHTGEGGMVVTDYPRLAERLRLIRNHGENVIESLGVKDMDNLFGFNFRMTELTAAIGIQQLKEVDRHVEARIAAAELLTANLSGLPGIATPKVRDNCSHVYYVWAFTVDREALGLDRATLSRAIAAEGIPHGVGYVRPLYMLPLFQRKAVSDRPDYRPGSCPVSERLYASDLVVLETCSYDLSGGRAEEIAAGIQRIHAHREQLATVSAIP
jgi:dTDP-4-amino-4,6-dideoxygalactose transaminase